MAPAPAADSGSGHRRGQPWGSPWGSGGSHPHLGPPNSRLEGDKAAQGWGEHPTAKAGVKRAGNGAEKKEGGAGAWMSLGVTRVRLGGSVCSQPRQQHGGSEGDAGGLWGGTQRTQQLPGDGNPVQD